MPPNLRHNSLKSILPVLNVAIDKTISQRWNKKYSIPTLEDLLPTWLETNASENWKKEDKIKKKQRVEIMVEVFMLTLLRTSTAITTLNSQLWIQEIWKPCAPFIWPPSLGYHKKKLFISCSVNALMAEAVHYSLKLPSLNALFEWRCWKETKNYKYICRLMWKRSIAC